MHLILSARDQILARYGNQLAALGEGKARTSSDLRIRLCRREGCGSAWKYLSEEAVFAFRHRGDYSDSVIHSQLTASIRLKVG